MSKKKTQDESQIIRRHPLAEVFGFPTDNLSADAERYRNKRLCPFNNKVPNCTKDKANDPLGVCSIFDENEVVITCPIRFREKWLIAEDAASFFFPPTALWTSMTEVRLKDKYGKSAGNIDVVLVAYDARGRVLDFGALEVQAVYISGNIRRPFERYLETKDSDLDWRGKANFPHPDYLSSSRKRLAPQLIFKGGILRSWGKKTAVALNKSFFATLPTLAEVDKKDADIAWMIYDLNVEAGSKRYVLQLHKIVYTKFDAALEQITKSEPGDMKDFVQVLQEKLDEKLENGNPPDAPILDEDL